MKIYQSLILSISLINVNSFSQDTVALQKDDKAPFTGILFSEEKSRKIKLELEEKDSYKVLYDSTQRSLNLLDQNLKLKDDQIDILMNQNNKLAMSLRDSKDFNSWERFAWFALGVVATGFAVYGLNQATK